MGGPREKTYTLTSSEMRQLCRALGGVRVPAKFYGATDEGCVAGCPRKRSRRYTRALRREYRGGAR